MYGINPDNIINSKPDVPQPNAADKPKEPSAVPGNDEPSECRIIGSDEELVYYSSNGWEIVKELSDGRFLMRRSGKGSGSQ